MRIRLVAALGARTILSRRRRLSQHLVGAVAGISLSLVPLVVVLEVADGMIEGITRRYLELGTYHLQVFPPPSDALSDYRRLAGLLRGMPGVREAIIERQGMGLLASPAGRTGVTVRAVPPDLYARDQGFRRYLEIDAGRFDLDSPQAILLGREVARKLAVHVGDTVRLLTLVRVGRRSLPRVWSFTVTGVFSSGYQELDKLWVYVPLERGLRVLPPAGAEQFVGVKLEDPYSGLNRQVARIEAALPPDVQVYGWYQLEKANYKSFQTTRALLLFIMALIVVVAAVNISSAVVMVVIEKTQEIGILKGVGARPVDISGAFVLTAALAGAVGTALGLALGVLVALNVNGLIAGLEHLLNASVAVFRGLFPFWAGSGTAEPIRIFNSAYYLETIPIRIRFRELFMVAAMSMLLSTGAGYFPARAAGRIRPLQVLRKV